MLASGAILNLTSTTATPEQVAGGVFDLCGPEGKQIRDLLDFQVLPGGPEVRDRAHSLAVLAALVIPSVSGALIGGPPYLVGCLHLELLAMDIRPVYGFGKGGLFTLDFPI